MYKRWFKDCLGCWDEKHLNKHHSPLNTFVPLASGKFCCMKTNIPGKALVCKLEETHKLRALFQGLRKGTPVGCKPDFSSGKKNKHFFLNLMKSTYQLLGIAMSRSSRPSWIYTTCTSWWFMVIVELEIRISFYSLKIHLCITFFLNTFHGQKTQCHITI